MGLSATAPDHTVGIEFGVIYTPAIGSVSKQIEDELSKTGVTNIQGDGKWVDHSLANGKPVRVTRATAQWKNQYIGVVIYAHETNHGPIVLMFMMSKPGVTGNLQLTRGNIVNSLN